MPATRTHPRQAPQLVKLDLSGNHLEEVENLECLARLQFLNLSYNRIASVLNIFRAVGNIATLILRGNQLASLKGIEKLVGLVRLDLRDNALRCGARPAARRLFAGAAADAVAATGRLDRLRSCRNLQEVALLADLPELTALWMQGNPMCSEAVTMRRALAAAAPPAGSLIPARMGVLRRGRAQSYRVTVFSLFAAQGNDIQLDGTYPSLTEQIVVNAISEEAVATRVRET